MKIGVGVPCHVNDEDLLDRCMTGIRQLDPAPHAIYVHKNRGEGGLKGVRNAMFTELFHECDVVLNCDVDFYLFPDILKHVRGDFVTSFAFLTRSLSDVPQSVARLLGFGWTGCYSIPKPVFEAIRSTWDGTDTSVKNLALRYRFVKTPKYYVVRAWRPETIRRLHREMPLARRLKWAFTKARI